jgi:hypothetical protein
MKASAECSVAGKTIIRVPKVGGLFSVEQLPQSEAWPALQFMIDQALRSSVPFVSSSLLTIHFCRKWI